MRMEQLFLCDLFNGSGTVVALTEKEVISVKIIENGTSKIILLRTAALLKKNVKSISFPLGADGAPVNFSRILCCPSASAEKIHSRKSFRQKMMNLWCISWKELKQVAVILSEHDITLVDSMKIWLTTLKVLRAVELHRTTDAFPDMMTVVKRVFNQWHSLWLFFTHNRLEARLSPAENVFLLKVTAVLSSFNLLVVIIFLKIR